MQIHLIAGVSVIERLRVCEFTLWGRDLVAVVSVRESPYYRGFFLKKIYENFVGTLKTVRNIEVSVLERCPYREVRLYMDSRFILPFERSRTALKGYRLPPSSLEKTRGCSLAIIGKA